MIPALFVAVLCLLLIFLLAFKYAGRIPRYVTFAGLEKIIC